MKGNTPENRAATGLAFQPLYKQVEEHVTRLIVAQRWKPGDMLPNEFQLAEEFGVSQGTVRKALNTLTQNNILTRRQGVGTFVSEHSGKQSLSRFFPMQPDTGAKPQATVKLLNVQLQSACPEVAEQLQLQKREMVFNVRRVVYLEDICCGLENIYLPEKYFSELQSCQNIPDNLYSFYQQQFKLTVVSASDKIKATLSSKEDVKLFDIEAGQPQLLVSRLSKALDGRLIEYQLNRYRSDCYHYLVNINQE